MTVVSARVGIEGRRPLLWHHFSAEAIAATPGARVERTGAKGNDPLEWKRTILITKERQLYLEPNYVFSCLREAGRHTKTGKGSLMPLIAATVQYLYHQIFAKSGKILSGQRPLRVRESRRDS